MTSFSCKAVCILFFVFQGFGVADADADAVRDSAKAILNIEDAYQPARPGFMAMAAGYLELTNEGDAGVRIIGVDSPDYQSVSIHKSVLKDGAYEMERVSSLELLAGETLSLEPGGLHLMLHQPVKKYAVGDVITVTFRLENGHDIQFLMNITKA